MAHLKSLIVVLPLARFAGDDDGPTITTTKVRETPPPARLPYIANE